MGNFLLYCLDSCLFKITFNLLWKWKSICSYYIQRTFSFLLFSGFLPVCSLGPSQVGRMNFGKDVSTLKYFTICGLQEGYEPFAVNTNRDITIWLSKRLPQFLPVPQNHEHIEVCDPFKMFLNTSISLFYLRFYFCTSRQDF